MNLLGISGETWSLIIQLSGMAVSLLLGVLGCRKSLTAMTVGIGILANVVGQIIFAGGGPGAFAGMAILPLFCIVAGHLGMGLRWLFVDRNKPAGDQ